MQEYVKTTFGQKECSAIIGDMETQETSLQELKNFGYTILEEADLCAEKLEHANNKIVIPLFKLENKQSFFYDLAVGYATGQIILQTEEGEVKRYNQTWDNNSVIFLLTDDFLNNSKYDWLSVLGLCYRAN